MTRKSSFTDRLRDLRSSWQTSKIRVLRSTLLILLAVMVTAQIFPSVSDFVVKEKFFSSAVVIGLVLVLFDTLLSHDQPPRAADGSVVLGHFTDLGEHLEAAFESNSVDLSIAAYSGETFYNVLSQFLQEVAEGTRKPTHLRVRLLVPDCSAPMAVPCLVNTLSEDPDYKMSIQERNRRFAGEFQNYFTQIRQRDPTIEAQIEIRVHRLSPIFKLIIINNATTFFALYPIAETAVNILGQTHQLWDYRGERARLVGVSAIGSQAEQELFRSLDDWFRSVWHHLATDLQR